MIKFPTRQYKLNFWWKLVVVATDRLPHYLVINPVSELLDVTR